MKCKNLECEKQALPNTEFCSEECMLKYKLSNIKSLNLGDVSDLWIGTSKRAKMTLRIIELIKENQPISIKQLVGIVSYCTGISRRVVQEDYLENLIDVGVIYTNGNEIHLTTKKSGEKKK